MTTRQSTRGHLQLEQVSVLSPDCYRWLMANPLFWPFARKLGDLTEADVDALIERAVPEGPFIEYKSEFDKSQTVRTVAAFANSQGGGTLLIGVEEDARVPKRASSIRATSGLGEQIVQTIRSNIAPVPDFSIKVIEVTDQKVCVVIQVPEGPQSPYIATQKGQVLIRTQVGTEPVKDRPTLDRLFSRGQVGRGWADARVGEVLGGTDSQARLCCIPAVAWGLAANEIILTHSFLAYLEKRLPVAMEGGFWQRQHVTAADHVSVSDEDAWMPAQISVTTTGIVKTTWTNKESESFNLSSVESLIKKALPVHREIPEEKLGHRGGLVVALASVINKSGIRVTRHDVPVHRLADNDLHESIKREIHRHLGGLVYEPEPEQ